MTDIAVYFEVGKRRVFASASDWPGWCRSSKDESSALQVLEEYRTRYCGAIGPAGRELAKAKLTFRVTDRVPGSATTDFGAPGSIPPCDAVPLDCDDATRWNAVVISSWSYLNKVASTAPQHLRKGPRGGGRDRDAIVQHVINAEVIYARKLGVRTTISSPPSDLEIDMLRGELSKAFRDDSAVGPDTRRWPIRYGARRIAWHVLDHAWEIEDKTD